MPAGQRFFIPPESWNAGDFALSGDEAHHSHDVMRNREGTEVTLFDGQGRSATAAIISSSRRSVELSLGDARLSPRPSQQLTLAQAIPKGKTMDLIIQKATELGVTNIVPLCTQRTIVQLRDRDAAKKQEKWQRVALEACKQCGQNWMPHISAPTTVAGFLQSPEAGTSWKIVGAIDERAQALEALQLPALEQEDATASILIGPEGDFTSEELAAAYEAGFAPLSLGDIILRSETAALHTLSIVSYEMRRRLAAG